MKKVLCGVALALIGCVMGGGLSTEVNAQVALPASPAAPATLDVVTLKNGSIIYGEVIEMAGGVLQIKTPASPDNLLKVNWNDVAKLSVNHPVPFHLKVRRAAESEGSTCLLDMGDNIGGGSAADGTTLIHALRDNGLSPALAVLCDPIAVKMAEDAGVGSKRVLSVGGRSDDLHGPPFTAEFTVLQVCGGAFDEPDARHGGIVAFDQGRTAVVATDGGLTLLINSIRTAPFSLNQLTSAGIDPARFRVIVAKGVHAPVAAYDSVCKLLLRVDTPGTTAADVNRFPYRHRRTPLFPFEESATYHGG